MNTATRDPGPDAKLRKILIYGGLVLLSLWLGLALVTGAALGPWFWLAAVFVLLIAWAIAGAGTSAAASGEPPLLGPHMLAPEEQPQVVRDVMDVQLAEEDRGVLLFRGRLRESAETVFAKLKAAFSAESLPLIQKDERCGAAILLMPFPPEARARRRMGAWLNWLLFGLTILTTTWAGASQQGVDLLQTPERFALGLPYAIALLAILGVHELGHFWVARRNGMDVTPPFFIPVPFALGTFGAFIQMRSPAESRRSLFDVAVAGPLAGLAVAIPVLLAGLQSSTVLSADSMPAHASGGLPGSSILFTAVARLALGPALEGDTVVQLSPLAFAGWLGFYVTALNLLPIGQLDGGHIARAMFGSRGGAFIGGVTMWTLVMLGLFVWPGLLMWALIVFLIAGRGAPPLNDITPISRARQWLGAFAFLLLASIIVPASVFGEW